MMETPSPDDHTTLILQLREHIKEIEFLRRVCTITANLSAPLDQAMQDITDRIPSMFREPERTCARVAIGSRVTQTANFRPCPWRLETPITASEGAVGTLEVGSLGALSNEGSPFLDEEQRLLQAIAVRIGLTVQHGILRENLEQSEKRYRTLADNALVGIIQSTLKGDLLYFNNEGLRMFGYESLEEARAAGTVSLYRNPEDRKRLLEGLTQTGKVADFEGEYVTKAGESIFILFNAALEGEVITGMMMDITDRKRAEDALIKSESTLAEAQRIAHVGSWEWDFGTGLLHWSDEVYRICGLQPQQFDVTFEVFFAMVHPDDRQELQKAIDRLLADRREDEGLELRIIRPDGSERTVYLQGEMTFDDNRQPIRTIGTVLDITDRKRTEEALRVSQDRFRSLVEMTSDWIWEIDSRGVYTYVSPKVKDLLGYRAEEVLGKTPFDLMPAREADRIAMDLKPVFDNVQPIRNLENINLHKDGHPVILETSGIPIVDPAGTLTGYRGVDRDITERKQAEEALIQSESRLIEAQRIGHVGSWEWDIVTGDLQWSDEVYRIFGFRPQQFGATYEVFMKGVHPEDSEAVRETMKRSITGPDIPYSVEHRVIRPDGSERTVHGRGEVTFDAHGTPVRMAGTVQDITDLKRAENEIRELKNRLEAENIYLREDIQEKEGYGDIIGTSDAIQSTMRTSRQVARTKTTVLLTGETGTGKGIFARYIHKTSDRRDKPFVNVNCAGLPASLIESELFGREKGAFTGSTARQIGRFELADTGTIFLDEIGELPLELQAKLLKVIEEGEFERLGSPHPVKVDVRIIASTNRSLQEEIEKGRFRQDLFFRLNVFPITIPPLRERQGDVSLLVKAYAEKFGKSYKKHIGMVPAKVMESLENYSWPGNVRELINVIERAVIVSDGAEFFLAEKMEAPSVETPSKRDELEGQDACYTRYRVEVAMKEEILSVLGKTGWRI
ncbi:MAG: sigma 54-interacting transcriptional regulator, partial [Methanoregulaceae archaeon]|nr:sigma 54-interacting transcriptional regulator [Methanoregulaceae archaeon]